MGDRSDRTWWHRLFPGANVGFWWRSLVCTLAWTVVLVVAGLLLSDHARRGESTAVNLGLCGVLIYPVTAFLAARSPSRWGWGAYLTISLVFAWVFGASVFFGTDVGS